MKLSKSLFYKKMSSQNKTQLSQQRNTQLTDPNNYDYENRIIFSDPQTCEVPGSDGKLFYKRINIYTKNEDGTVGELILPTCRVFSFGVSKNVDPATKKVNGYSMSLCLWNRDGASEEEKTWTNMFNDTVEYIKNYVYDHRDDIDKYDLDQAELKKFNPLYWKKEKGKVVEGTGPTLYAKLIKSSGKKRKTENKDDGNIHFLSKFYDINTGDELNPLNLEGQYCYVVAAVKIESIYIGSKITLQIKLHEANVEIIQNNTKSLLPRAPPKPRSLLDTEPKRVEVNEKEIAPNSDDEDDNATVAVQSRPEPVKKRIVRPHLAKPPKSKN